MDLAEGNGPVDAPAVVANIIVKPIEKVGKALVVERMGALKYIQRITEKAQPWLVLLVFVSHFYRYFLRRN